MGSRQGFFLVKAFAVVFGQEEKMAAFFAEADLQIVRLGVFKRIMDDLLDHPENMDLFFFGHQDLLYHIELDIGGLFEADLAYEFPDGFYQPLSFQCIGQEVMRYLAHAADDLVQVSGSLFQHCPVLGMFDVYAADIELDGGKQGAEAIVQVARDPFAFVLPDGDFRKDPFPLQPHVSSVIADNGSKKVDNYCSDNYRKENSNIQDLAFHLQNITWQLLSPPSCAIAA